MLHDSLQLPMLHDSLQLPVLRVSTHLSRRRSQVGEVKAGPGRGPGRTRPLRWREARRSPGRGGKRGVRLRGKASFLCARTLPFFSQTLLFSCGGETARKGKVLPFLPRHMAYSLHSLQVRPPGKAGFLVRPFSFSRSKTVAIGRQASPDHCKSDNTTRKGRLSFALKQCLWSAAFLAM